MARRGEIEIPVGIDTGGFEKGVRNGLIDPIEDVEDALDQLGKVDAGTDLERDLGKAQDATEDLDRELDQTRKSLDKLGYAARDAGDDGVKGMRKIKDGADEVTTEGFANAAEAVSSFRGDVEDLGQIGQDTLGGLAGTLAGTGPAGIVGAVGLAAAAAGWGLITQSIQDQEEAARKLRERLTSAYEDAASEGRSYIDTAQFIAEANDLIFNPDRADEYKKIREDAKRLNLDESLLIKANSGDLESQKIVRQEINKFLESDEAHLDSIYGKNKGLSDEATEMRDRWEDIAKATDEATASAENSKKVTSEFLLDAARNASYAEEEVDKFGNRLLRLPDGTEFVVDAKTGQAHQDMDRFYGDADGKVDRLNKKDINLKLKAKDETGATLAAAVGRITGTTAYVTIGAKTGASVGAAIGRFQRG